jgi:hypothetical protein
MSIYHTRSVIVYRIYGKYSVCFCVCVNLNMTL